MTNAGRSHRVETAPWWVACLLSFALGAAVMAAILLPAAITPDFQRGHTAGYEQGWNDAIAVGNLNVEAVYKRCLEKAAK